MNIIFNPLSNNALTESQLKNNDDIIFDLPGNNIFAKGVKFYGTDTHVEVLDVLDSDRTDAALSANMGRILDLNKVPYNNQTREPDSPSQFGTIICPTNKSRQEDVPTDDGLLFRTNTGNIADLWISSDDNYIYKRQNNGEWQKIGAGYADSINWDNIINAPTTLPNPKSLIIFDVPYDGSEQVTITPNNYIYKVAKADIGTNPITDGMAFIGTYYDPSDYVESVSNTPLRYSVNDMWDNWLKPKIENWYETQDSKVNATLWGNSFTGTENISGSLYLSDGSQIYINKTEILDYQSKVLYLGYGTREIEKGHTYIYGGQDITLFTQGYNRFKITTSDININLPVYANNTMNVTNGLYLSNHIIGKLNNTTQSYTDPWWQSNADFRFGGSLAATKIYASQGFYHPNYDSTTGEIYLLTADGDTTTVNSIRSAIYVRQNNSWDESYPLIWADEANTYSQYNTYLYKSYDKLTFNPSTSSLTIGSSNNPTSSMWIDGMVKAAVNTYSNGYRAWISGSTSSGRLSIGSFGNGPDYTDGNIYFSYATTADINTNTNNVNSGIWINPKTNIINSTHYSGWSYTATGGYHLQRDGSDVAAGLIATDGGHYQTTNTTYYGSHPWGCIPIINGDSGLMEIGKYLDFHNENDGRDFSTRLWTDGNYGNNVLMPKKSGRLLVESDLDDAKKMYEVVINLHPFNCVLNNDNEYVQVDGSYKEDTWYPVEIQLYNVGDYIYPVIRGEILQYLACGYTNSQGTWVKIGSDNCRWMTHQNGFSTRIVFESQASGWGTTPNNILRVIDANQTWCIVNPVRNIVQDYKSNSIIVWCRGYGEYRFRFNYPHIGVIVHTSSFSLGSSDNIYKPYSFSSYINDTDYKYWNDIWEDLNSKLPEIKPTLGYWADVAVSNTSSKDTSPTFYTVWAQDMFRSIGQTGWYNETFLDGIVMKQSNWIETWAGANIYTPGAMSASKLLVGLGKSTDTNYDLDISNTNGSRFKGTINTSYGAIVNKPSIDFRGGVGIGSWTSWCHHETTGNEALLFATENTDTTIMFANGILQSSINNSLYQSIKAPLRIQQNKVWMGYQYQANPSSSYTLNVTNGIGVDLINVSRQITSNAFYLQGHNNDHYLISTNGSYMQVLRGTTSYSTGIQIGNMVWLYINGSGFGSSSRYIVPSNISAPTSEVRVLGFTAGRGNWDKFRVGTFKISSGSRYLTHVEGDTDVVIYQTVCYTV